MDQETVTAAISAAVALIQYITKARDAAQQSEEWSEADRMSMDAKIANIPSLPHWQAND